MRQALTTRVAQDCGDTVAYRSAGWTTSTAVFSVRVYMETEWVVSQGEGVSDLLIPRQMDTPNS